jgi:hypothetical protein
MRILPILLMIGLLTGCSRHKKNNIDKSILDRPILNCDPDHAELCARINPPGPDTLKNNYR